MRHSVTGCVTLLDNPKRLHRLKILGFPIAGEVCDIVSHRQVLLSWVWDRALNGLLTPLQSGLEPSNGIGIVRFGTSLSVLLAAPPDDGQ
jgi:hypothetical protein